MSVNTYGKAYGSMFHRSMSGSGPLLFAVWAYVISHTEPEWVGGEEIGVTELNPPMVAFLIGGCTAAEVESEIERLCAPDPRSESTKEEGRRLVRLTQFRYRVVNFMDYRNRVSKSPSAIANREAVARHRARKAAEQEKPKEPEPEKPAEFPEKDRVRAQKLMTASKYPQEAQDVLLWLNAQTGRDFRMIEANLSVIAARLAEPGVTVDGVKQMISRMAAKWKGGDYEEFLRPETLFGKKKFDGYYTAKEMPVARNGTTNGTAPAVGPTQAQVIDYARDKGATEVFAASFYGHWSRQQWQRKGRNIDWKIEFTESWAQHKPTEA